MEIAKISTRVRPPRRFGSKQVFLPNFVLTMIRPPPTAPPNFASFIVPLKLNKLDMRDYLWNVYGVSCTSVRSYIQMQKLRNDKKGAKRPVWKKYRPRSIKKMLVELDKPFVFPKEMEDLSLWDKKTYDAAKKDQKEMEEAAGPTAGYSEDTKARKSTARQARELLASKDPWRSTTKYAPVDVDEWEDFGEEVEVEQEVDLKKTE